MTWHIVVNVGDEEPKLRKRAMSEPRVHIAFESQGDPAQMRQDVITQIHKYSGQLPSQTAIDLLHLGMSVYAADKLVLRDYEGHSSRDNWTRDIEIHLPVGEPAAWKKIIPILRNLLGFLSGDNWNFHFTKRKKIVRKKSKSKPQPAPDICSLFSGGLDSLCGVIDLLECESKTLMVGHYDAGMTSDYQTKLGSALKKEYKVLAQQLRLRVQSPQIGIGTKPDHETTQRSRSFLFIALGIAAANAFGPDIPLAVPENGLISLNVPLTASRSGSHSTRTTHPYYIRLYREMLQALNIDNPLVLPFRYKTKGEMMDQSKNKELLANLASSSMSCSHSEAGRYDGVPPSTHCGYCWPCLIRRASFAAAGVEDLSSYWFDTSDIPSPKISKKGYDFRAVQIALRKFSTRSKRKKMFDVLDAGPIAPEEIEYFVDVYDRGMKELSAFVSST